jgi:predicted SAM-dependent methyltransferase|uniref:Methyltransferase type 11 domain-containing protein n=1 Tax=Chlorobium chlorochromatii (strain CaD3) TaxID=340177 RepID=Q3APS4_CHLCH
MKILLHIGCGIKDKTQTTLAFHNEEWDEIRYDIDPDVAPDIVGNMTDLITLAPASVDAIYASNCLETLYPHEVPQALAEFRRVLTEDGFVVINSPDLQAVCTLVAKGKVLDPAFVSPENGLVTPFDLLFGHRPSLAEGNMFMAHRCGFTSQMLSGALQAAGFSMVASMVRPKHYDLWTVASKSQRTEPEMRALASEHFPGLGVM